MSLFPCCIAYTIHPTISADPKGRGDRNASLLDLGLLSCLLFTRFRGLSVQRLGRELWAVLAYDGGAAVRARTVAATVTYFELEEGFLEAGHGCECTIEFGRSNRLRRIDRTFVEDVEDELRLSRWTEESTGLVEGRADDVRVS